MSDHVTEDSELVGTVEERILQFAESLIGEPITDRMLSRVLHGLIMEFGMDVDLFTIDDRRGLRFRVGPHVVEARA